MKTFAYDTFEPKLKTTSKKVITLGMQAEQAERLPDTQG